MVTQVKGFVRRSREHGLTIKTEIMENTTNIIQKFIPTVLSVHTDGLDRKLFVQFPPFNKMPKSEGSVLRMMLCYD